MTEHEGWADVASIEPASLDDTSLVQLAGFALGLRGTKTNRTAADCREIGDLMVRLLGHVAYMERLRTAADEMYAALLDVLPARISNAHPDDVPDTRMQTAIVAYEVAAGISADDSTPS
jgi:hypothetical protein